MNNKQDSFVFYRSFWEASKILSDADRIKLYDAICAYSLDNDIPNLGEMSNALFQLIRPQLDANNRRRESGKKGGRPKQKKPMVIKNENQRLSKEETNGYKNEKPNVNKNVNTNANNNENVNAKDINFESMNFEEKKRYGLHNTTEEQKEREKAVMKKWEDYQKSSPVEKPKDGTMEAFFAKTYGGAK